MRLTGHQLARATQQHPQTSEAAVCLQIGSTMLYLRELENVYSFHEIWREQRPRMRSLPYSAGAKGLIAVSGTTSEPGVVLHAKGEPPASSLLVPGQGSKAAPYIRVHFDRITFKARDQEAYATTLLAVDHAAELAHQTFIEPIRLRPPRLGLRLPPRDLRGRARRAGLRRRVERHGTDPSGYYPGFRALSQVIALRS